MSLDSSVLTEVPAYEEIIRWNSNILPTQMPKTAKDGFLKQMAYSWIALPE